MSVSLDTVEQARLLLDQWVESLAEVLASMTDQRPEVRWEATSGPFADLAGAPAAAVLWWEQPFQLAPDMTVWVAAPGPTWEFAGTLTLKAAGLETVEPSEAKNTWFEILGQSLSSMARAIGSRLGREVTCGTGIEQAAGPDVQQWASVYLTFKEAPLAPLLVTFSRNLLDMISNPPEVVETGDNDAVPADDNPPEAPGQPLSSRTMDLLLDVDLAVSISFGKTQLAMKDVLKLTTGSIVELNRGVNEPVEVLVNQCLIARGEVVVVDGNYGVRIQEISSRQDRLRGVK
jgi:flagellar motor switch protein FliN/FliY